jgi:hypothetical protein
VKPYPPPRGTSPPHHAVRGAKKNKIIPKNVADAAPPVKAGRVKKFINFPFDKAQIPLIIFL